MKIKKVLLFVLRLSVICLFCNDTAVAMRRSQPKPVDNNPTDPLSRSISQRPSPVYSPPTQSESVFEPKPRHVSRSSQPSTPSPFVPVRSEPTVEVKSKPVRAPSESTSRTTAPVQPSGHSTTKAPYVPETTPFLSLDILTKPEDALVQRGLAALLDERIESGRLPASFRKGLEARDAESYFSDAQTKAFSADEQLAGCLVHLIAQGKTSSLRELFDNPNWKLWVYLAHKIGIKTTCLDVVRSLNGAKQLFVSSLYSGQLSSLAEGFINTALTKIFYGCWGISSEPTEPDVIQELKGIARNIGRGRNRSLYAASNQAIGSYDQYNSGAVEDRLQEHYLVVSQEIADGSSAAQPLKQHFISLFGARSFNPDLIQRTLGSLYGGARPLPQSPLSGLMISILTDSQLRKNISKEKDNPRLNTILSGYADAELMKLYGVVGCAGFDLKKEKRSLESRASAHLISALPASAKVWFLVGNVPLDVQAINSLSERNIQDVIRQNYPFQNSILAEAIDRNDLPTWLRLVLLKHKAGLTRPEASTKALPIIQTRNQVSPAWVGFQTTSLGNDFMGLITLYDHLCQISKPCTNADFLTHKPFLDLCLARAQSADLNFEAKRDVFRWLRGLTDPRGSVSSIQTYQTDDVIPALEHWSKEPLLDAQKDALESSSQAWFQHPIKYERFSYGKFTNMKDLINVTKPYPADPDTDCIKRIYFVVQTLLDMNLLRLGQNSVIEESGWNRHYKNMAVQFHPDKHSRKPWVKEAEDVFQNITGLNVYVKELYTTKVRFHTLRRLYNEKLERESRGDFS